MAFSEHAPVAVTSVPLADQTFFSIQIHDNAEPGSSLITELGEALNRIEDEGSSTSALFHVRGSEENLTRSWPGECKITDISRWERLLHRIERSSLFTLSYVEETCSMLSLDLLLVTDYRIGANTYTARATAARRRVWPGVALSRLCKQIGEARTRKLLLSSELITAESACNVGLVDELVSDLPGGLAQVRHLLSCGPTSDFAIQRRLMQERHTSFNDALGSHLAACERALRQERS